MNMTNKKVQHLREGTTPQNLINGTTTEKEKKEEVPTWQLMRN